MKNLFKNLLMLTAVASLGLMFGCNEDGETFDAPILTVESSQLDGEFSFEGAPGVPLSYKVVIVADAGFNTLYENDVAVDSKDPGTTPTTWEYPVTIEIPTALGTYNYEYYAVDEAGVSSNSITVTVEVTSPLARSYSAVLLAPPLGDLSAQSFYSVSSGTKYSPEEVTGTPAAISPTIDFGYYYGANDMASIASPLKYGDIFAPQVEDWTTKNATIIKATDLDASAFIEVTTWADIDEVFEAATDEEGIITNLSTSVSGKMVVAFETVNGVRGLILINEIIDGNDPQDGNFDGELDAISIDIIAQLEAL